MVWELIRSDYPGEAKLESLLKFDQILGLSLKDTWQELQEPLPEEIQKLVQEREKLRKETNWDKADKVREQIRSLGFEIKDTERGPLVTRIPQR